jgi:hypothetical protein
MALGPGALARSPALALGLGDQNARFRIHPAFPPMAAEAVAHYSTS